MKSYIKRPAFALPLTAVLVTVIIMFSACSSPTDNNTAVTTVGTSAPAVSVTVSNTKETESEVTETSITNSTVFPDEPEINVPYIEGTSDKDGFIRGMDISTVMSLYKTWEHTDGSAHFKDFGGNELDIQSFFDLLHDTGTNYIRLRVWNNPFTADGKVYGGGNVDINAAVTMGKYATNAGMKVLIDFHYSDFWADPSKQMCPKAWDGMSIDEKADALYEYTADCMKKLLDAGVDVGMVQLGNETTGRMSGESKWDNLCALFSAGSRAVREADGNILIAIHFTNPENSSSYGKYAKQLDDHSVDYDIFASSWYPYWHGTLANLTKVLTNVSETYGKKVIVVETSWAYTLEDGDGSDNTVREDNNSNNAAYDFSAQGQADLICDVIRAVKAVGENGIGVFYWEPAWIPVQIWNGSDEKLAENKALWEEYGSGWATSYAGEYDPNDAGKWYGGSAWDNQALFTFDGNPLPSLMTYRYIQQKP